MNQCFKEKEIYLCKFSEKREWLEQLSCGRIYTHSIEYYRDLEGKEHRGDKYDGMKLLQGTNGKVYLGNPFIDKNAMLLGKSQNMKSAIQQSNPVNLFCSTIMNNEFLDLIRNDYDNWYEYFNKFGDFVGIFSVYELVEKIKEIPSIRYGKVKYFSDESIDIIKIFNNIYEETCFYKRKNPFAIENEYRVALYGAYDDPFIVETTKFKQFEIFTFDEFFERKIK